MSTTVNGHTIPTPADIRDTNENAEWENLESTLTSICGNVSSAGALSGITTIECTSNVGTANTGVTAVEYGDGYNHTTVLTVSQAAALTLADNASLADGYLLYTFPAGALFVNSSYISMNVTNAEHDTEACDVGLGTTIATGAVAVLGGTAGFENILTGQTAAVGTAEVAQALATASPFALPILSGDSHLVHFNVAAAWADTAGTALDADIAGTVVLNWTFLA